MSEEEGKRIRRKPNMPIKRYVYSFSQLHYKTDGLSIFFFYSNIKVIQRECQNMQIKLYMNLCTFKMKFRWRQVVKSNRVCLVVCSSSWS